MTEKSHQVSRLFPRKKAARLRQAKAGPAVLDEAEIQQDGQKGVEAARVHAGSLRKRLRRFSAPLDEGGHVQLHGCEDRPRGPVSADEAGQFFNVHEDSLSGAWAAPSKDRAVAIC